MQHDFYRTEAESRRRRAEAAARRRRLLSGRDEVGAPRTRARRHGTRTR